MMASGWHTYIGSSPETYGVSIRRETKSWSLIEKSGCFGVNFLEAQHSGIIHHAGTLTGFDVNKFQKLGLRHKAGNETGVPVLEDAYLCYECRVIDVRQYGDHCLVVGEIAVTHKDERCFLDDGSVDLDRMSIPLYIGRSNYRTLDSQALLVNHWRDPEQEV